MEVHVDSVESSEMYEDCNSKAYIDLSPNVQMMTPSLAFDLFMHIGHIGFFCFCMGKSKIKHLVIH